MNIHDVLAEGNFSNEEGKAIELQIVMDHNHQVGYVDKCDRMAISYSISHHTFKWTKKLFSHLLNLALLNNYIPRVGVRKFHTEIFDLPFVRNMLAHAGPEWRMPRPLGRPPNVEAHIARLKVCGKKHEPILSAMQLRCRMCKARAVTKSFR